MGSCRLGLYKTQRGFFTLIGLLVVLVIIGILMAMYGLPGGTGTGAGGGATTVAGGAKERAQDVVCRNNLNQLRGAVGVYTSTGQGYPPSLESLNVGVSLSCPVGGEPYDYDPTTGKVSCIHPGHESF